MGSVRCTTPAERGRRLHGDRLNWLGLVGAGTAEAIGAALSGGFGAGNGNRNGSASFGTATEASFAVAGLRIAVVAAVQGPPGPGWVGSATARRLRVGPRLMSGRRRFVCRPRSAARQWRLQATGCTLHRGQRIALVVGLRLAGGQCAGIRRRNAVGRHEWTAGDTTRRRTTAAEPERKRDHRARRGEAHFRMNSFHPRCSLCRPAQRAK